MRSAMLALDSVAALVTRARPPMNGGLMKKNRKSLWIGVPRASAQVHRAVSGEVTVRYSIVVEVTYGGFGPSIGSMANRVAGPQLLTYLLFLASDPPFLQRRRHCLSSRTHYFRRRAVLPRCPYARPSRSLGQSAWQGQQRTDCRLEEEKKRFLAR